MKLTNRTAESSAPQIAAVALKNAPTPAENVRVWWKKARLVYPEATLRAWRFDWAAFLQFCKVAVAGGAIDRRRVHRGLQ